MRKNHFRALSAVFPIITKTEGGRRHILLHKRANTGYCDGMWDIAASGHVDEGETAIQALIREGQEELGIQIDPAGVEFVHLTHSVDSGGEETYYNIYFRVSMFAGEPRIMEPEKCAGLDWFCVDSLPEDMIPARRADVRQALAGSLYSEYMDER